MTYRGCKTLVLCYHAVSPTWPSELAVAPESFERQIKTLLRRGYRATTFSSATSEDTTFAITFDDSFRSVFDYAFPILNKLGVVATVFVPTGFVGSDDPMCWPGIDHWVDGPHRRELECMTWDQLRELTHAGWEVGSHTQSHPLLTTLSDDEMLMELSNSRMECERELDQKCTSIAYPYGDVNSKVINSALSVGYENGAGLPARLHPPRQLNYPRIGVYPNDNGLRYRLKVSPLVRRLRLISYEQS